METAPRRLLSLVVVELRLKWKTCNLENLLAISVVNPHLPNCSIGVDTPKSIRGGYHELASKEDPLHCCSMARLGRNTVRYGPMLFSVHRRTFCKVSPPLVRGAPRTAKNFMNSSGCSMVGAPPQKNKMVPTALGVAYF